MKAMRKAQRALRDTGCTRTGTRKAQSRKGQGRPRPHQVSVAPGTHGSQTGERGMGGGGCVCVCMCAHTQTSRVPGPAEAPPGQRGRGAYRRAEVAAARAALVLHHPAPVVLAQHQQRRLAGRTHQLVLDHAVRAPAQLQPDNSRVSGRAAGGWAEASPRWDHTPVCAVEDARPPEEGDPCIHC